LKKSFHSNTHAVFFTGKSPSTLKGEKLTKRRVRMLPDSPRHQLDPASRLNYANVYPVERNVKVQFIGKIDPKYEQEVITDYNSTHSPLPDRPYAGDIAEDVFGHAGAQHHDLSPQRRQAFLQQVVRYRNLDMSYFHFRLWT
jgi:hypothetical protein